MTVPSINVILDPIIVAAKTQFPVAYLSVIEAETTLSVAEIAKNVNPVIADGFALYEKTKNFYLHLAGMRNRDYQLLFDNQAWEIFDSMDEHAEQVRQIGVTTFRSTSHTGELQSVKSYHSDFLSPGKMMEELIDDNQQIAVSLRVAGKICRKMRETMIGNILQGILEQTERRIRFLSESKMKI